MSLGISGNPHKLVKLSRQAELFVITHGVTDDDFDWLVSRLADAIGSCVYALGSKFNFQGNVEEQLYSHSQTYGITVDVRLRLVQQLDPVAVPEDQREVDGVLPRGSVLTQEDVSNLLANFLLNDGTKTIKVFRRQLKEHQLTNGSLH